MRNFLQALKDDIKIIGHSIAMLLIMYCRKALESIILHFKDKNMLL